MWSLFHYPCSQCFLAFWSMCWYLCSVPQKNPYSLEWNARERPLSFFWIWCKLLGWLLSYVCLNRLHWDFLSLTLRAQKEDARENWLCSGTKTFHKRLSSLSTDKHHAFISTLGRIKGQVKDGEVAQHLRVLTTLGEDPDSVLSTHMVAYTVCNSRSIGFDVLFWPLPAPGKIRYIYTHVRKYLYI